MKYAIMFFDAYQEHLLANSNCQTTKLVKMKKLIIGANGNLGREIVKQLSAKTNVVAGVRSEKELVELNNAECVVFDYDEPETFAAALENVDAVFIQAPPLDFTAFERLTPFINHLKENGINRVVFNSALGVDHNEDAPLRKLERKLMNDGFNYTFTRPNFFMENFITGFAAAPLQHDDAIIANAGDAKLSFVSIKDLAAIITEAFMDDKHIKKEYNVTGQEALSHGDLAVFFTNKTGRTINYISLSPEQMKAGVMENGLPESVAGYLVMLYNIAAEGHMAHCTNDINEVLGRAPKTFNELI